MKMYDFVIILCFIGVCTILIEYRITSELRQLKTELMKPLPDMKEYQVELDMDTVRVFDNGRYVGCYIIEDELNAFDEICAMDSR